MGEGKAHEEGRGEPPPHEFSAPGSLALCRQIRGHRVPRWLTARSEDKGSEKSCRKKFNVLELTGPCIAVLRPSRPLPRSTLGGQHWGQCCPSVTGRWPRPVKEGPGLG